ncbi:MAG: hypothetical protein AAF615_07710, partial [Pseudomonadota bacterium]
LVAAPFIFLTESAISLRIGFTASAFADAPGATVGTTMECDRCAPGGASAVSRLRVTRDSGSP